MKVSEVLRQYELSGEVPDVGNDSMLNFYSKWLIAMAYKETICTLDQARDMAIKVAEFIETRARE